jgi:hypothetical protein
MAFAAEHHSHDPVPSPWPIVAAFGLGFVPIGLILNAHGHKQGLLVLAVGLAITFFGAGNGRRSSSTASSVGIVDADSRQKRAFLMFILSGAIFSAFFAAILYSRRTSRFGGKEIPFRGAHSRPSTSSSSSRASHPPGARAPGATGGRPRRMPSHDDLPQGALPLRAGVQYRFLNGSAFTIKRDLRRDVLRCSPDSTGCVLHQDHLPERGLRHAVRSHHSSRTPVQRRPGAGTSSTSCGYASSHSSIFCNSGGGARHWYSPRASAGSGKGRPVHRASHSARLGTREASARPS